MARTGQRPFEDGLHITERIKGLMLEVTTGEA